MRVGGPLSGSASVGPILAVPARGVKNAGRRRNRSPARQRTVGASGTVVAGGFALVAGAASTAGVVGTDSTASTTTIDTTASTALTLFATWGAASASNTLLMEQFIVEELG